jgi:microcystin degradation protein MlrC
MIDTCRMLGIELVPTVFARAGAAGVIKEEVYDSIMEEMLSATEGAGELDGFLAILHGGGMAVNHDDMEGDILSSIRDVVGEGAKIGTTFDFHGKISELQLEKADLINGYDLFPHTDTYDRGQELVVAMVSTVEGELNPTMALRKPMVLPNLQGEYTGREPMTRILDRVWEIEEDEGVVFATVNGGFPYCDTENAGFSVVVTTKNDMRLAEEKADEIADLVWKYREGLCPKLPSVKEAVAEAITWAEHMDMYNQKPVILSEVGDSAGSGSYNDGTSLFKEMLEADLKNGVFGPICTPSAVAEAIKAGVGEEVTVKVGGKTDEAMEVTGIVKVISDGKYQGMPRVGETKPPAPAQMGRTVVIRCNGMDLLISELPVQFSHLEGFRSVGVEPTRKRYIGIKSPAHFRGAFEPIAKYIIEVDTPGLSNPNLETFDFKKIRRPIYPLDDI